MNVSKLLEHFDVETDTPPKPIVAYTASKFDISNVTRISNYRGTIGEHIEKAKQPLKLNPVDKIVIVNVELKKARKRKANWRSEYDLDEVIEAATFALVEGEFGVGVMVIVGDVADGEEIAAAGDIDAAGKIVVDGPPADFHRLVLSPALVEGNPLHDGGMAVETVDHSLEFGHELGVRFRRPGVGLRVRLEAPGPFGIIQSGRADVILPDHHAEPIAVKVIAARLDLDVLADGVEAGGLEEFDVGDHGFIGGRREQAVGPPTLVEGAPVEDGFSIEGEAEVTLVVADAAELADADVGFDDIIAELDLKIVEGGRSGAPEFRVRNL